MMVNVAVVAEDDLVVVGTVGWIAVDVVNRENLDAPTRRSKNHWKLRYAALKHTAMRKAPKSNGSGSHNVCNWPIAASFTAQRDVCCRPSAASGRERLLGQLYC